MEYVYVCPECGKTFSTPDYYSEYQNGKTCEDCNKRMVYSGFIDEAWNAFTEEERQEKINAIRNQAKPKGDNTIASIITKLAIVDFVVWFFLGFILGKDLYGDFSFISALLYWAIGFVSGIMLLGFAEIINLLHSINKKIQNIEN